jgi:uncharacterized protein
VKSKSNDYVIRVLSSLAELEPHAWNRLLALQASPTPFMRHEYLAAMELSRSAIPKTGCTPRARCT